MCGIVGIVDTRKQSSRQSLHNTVGSMAETLTHRGPDDKGIWINEKVGIGLGHRRLSIVDLTISGQQPMVSSSGRFVITFNGEIYNYLELKDELNIPKSRWKGSSDTEVMLTAFEKWGVVKSLEKFVGMFAFGVYDAKLNKLLLVRDRIGEKPLYYGWINNYFIIASELKAIRAIKSWQPTINRQALACYFKFGYIAPPLSIYQDVNKLEPGHMLEISLGNLSAKNVTNTVYWNSNNYLGNNTQLSYQDQVERMESLLEQSVKQQLRSDVSVGAFLSSGIDSSLVTNIMQKYSTKSINTYSVSSENSIYNEGDKAREIAKVLGTRHQDIKLSSSLALEIIPKLADIYDEPFCDSSQIPTYLVSQLARHDVTVSLSGDGGDELFCGYRRYTDVIRYHKLISQIPTNFRAVIGKSFDKVIRTIPLKNIRNKLSRADKWWESDCLQDFYLKIMSIWNKYPFEFLENNPHINYYHSNVWNSATADIKKLMHIDLISYLPDDLLVKVDRASMANSLEVRAPYLDHRLVEFALGLPISSLTRGSQTKIILRDILKQYLPEKLISKQKKGFGIPLDDWLRNDVKLWAYDILKDKTIRKRIDLDWLTTEKIWQDHQSGRANNQAKIWSIVTYMMWFERWMG